MSLSSPLLVAIEHALASRQDKGALFPDLSNTIPSSAPDFFSNDYLSLTTAPELRTLFFDKLSATSPTLLFGSSGSRLGTGNTPVHVAFEARMQAFFGAPAALLCSSGFDANLAFWNTVPQKGDTVVFDELAHASIRDGVAGSRARGAQYAFAHNSVSAFRQCAVRVLKEHPEIAAGRATMFVALEGLYSMDGDFAPLREIVEAAEGLVPPGCAHVVVDEAHSTAICGPGGRGFVAALGLTERVGTVLHTFSKAYGMAGAVLLTSPFIKSYIANYARAFMYSTAMPCSSVVALNAIFDYLESPADDKRRESLRRNCARFVDMLSTALEEIPAHILRLRARDVSPENPEDVVSPVFALLTDSPKQLETILRQYGYGVTGLPYPVVPRGEERIRVIVHAGNSLRDMQDFVDRLKSWGKSKIVRDREDSGELHLEAKL